MINKPWGKDGWALFNLADDIGEQHDLSESEPEKLTMMIEHYDNYVSENGVAESSSFYHPYSNTTSYYDN